MSRKMVFQGVEIGFPSACVVCGGPVEKDYKVTRTMTYGNRSITITLPVPMCATHFAMATSKNAKERAVERVGQILGAVLGLAAGGALLAMWSATGQGNLFLNIFLALVVFAGAFLIVWMTALLAVAPNFADPETKAARQAVRIRQYAPAKQQLQLEFANDQIAERVARANPATLVQ